MKRIFFFILLISGAFGYGQSTINSFTYSTRFLNSDLLQMYEGARIAAPTMTLPSSISTYTYSQPFINTDNLQLYNAIRGIGDAVSTGSSNAWNITGNAPATNTNFIGTTNNTSLLFRTNNTQRLKIDSLGQAVFTHTDVNTPALSVKNSTNQIGFYMDSPSATIPMGFGSISNSNFGFFTNFGTNIAAFTTNNRFSIGKPNFSSYNLPASLLELRAQSTSSANKVFGVRNSTDLSDVFFISDVGTMSVSSTATLGGLSIGGGTISAYEPAFIQGSSSIGISYASKNTNSNSLSGFVGYNNSNNYLAMYMGGTTYSQVGIPVNNAHILSDKNIYLRPLNTVVTIGNYSVSGNLSLGNTSTLTGGNSGTLAVLSDCDFSLNFMCLGTALADATTYYFSNMPISAMTSSANVLIPSNCTLIGYSANFIVNGGAASAETGTLGINVNGTRTNLSTSIQQNLGTGINTYTATNLSQSLNAGDVINPFFTSPTWVTNPGTTCVGITLYFRRRL